MDYSNRIGEIEKRLAELQVERHRLLAEMAVLQEDEQLTITSLEPIGKPAAEKVPVLCLTINPESGLSVIWMQQRILIVL